MALKEKQFNYSPLPQDGEDKKIDFFAPTPEEEILANREIVSKNYLHGDHINSAHCVEFKDDGKGIFKPNEFSHQRERAAYLVDRFLDFNLVPPTVIRKIDGKIGSVQQFIPDTNTYYNSPAQVKIEINKQLIKMFIFDHIIFNSDRHGANFLISQDNKIHAIDHEASFCKFCNIHLKVFPDAAADGTLYDHSIPEELIEQIKIALANTDKQKELDKLLQELLSDDDREAFFTRLNRISKIIIEKGCLPNPYKTNRENPDLGIRHYD